MAILYTINIRTVTKKTGGISLKGKFGYAVAKQRGTYSTEEFASKMEAFAGNGYGRNAFVAILADIALTLGEVLADGMYVDLGSMGKFYPAISSEGVFDASKFNPSANIKKVYARWGKSKKLAEITDPKPTYEMVATTSITDAGKKGAKQAKHTVQIRPVTNENTRKSKKANA